MYQKGCDKKQQKKTQKQSNIECLADVYLCGGGGQVDISSVEIGRKDEKNVSPLINRYRGRIDKTSSTMVVV